MACFWIFIFLFWRIESGNSQRDLSLQPGASITILCHYDKQYIQNKKYGCFHAYSAFNFCGIQAYANNTAGRVIVTDYPAQTLFTVTMRDLQTGDTGSYWCAVEIGGVFDLDVKEQILITVKSGSIPDVGVEESSVRGQVGDKVMVQCLYSAGFQDNQKQWCRSKDQSCYAVGRTNTSQNSAVQISDDGSSRFFSVQMIGLQKSDAGWYGCRIGNQEVPVHLSVSDAAPASTKTSSSPGTSTQPGQKAEEKSTSENNSSYATVTQTPPNKNKEKEWNWVLLAVGLVLLLLFLVVILFCTLKKKKKKCKGAMGDETGRTKKAFKTEDSVTYSSLVHKKKAELSVPAPEIDVTYSSVQNFPKTKTFSPAVGDDGVIYSSVFHI